jgi:hypothetical protein
MRFSISISLLALVFYAVQGKPIPDVNAVESPLQAGPKEGYDAISLPLTQAESVTTSTHPQLLEPPLFPSTHLQKRGLGVTLKYVLAPGV